MTTLDEQWAVLDGLYSRGWEDFQVPLVSHIEGNLYMGGCHNGVKLPDDVAFVVSLYPWEKYQLGPNTKREEYRLYDSGEIPDVALLADVAGDVMADMVDGKVLVHCQAGLNRSGLICALVLMGQGRSAVDAIRLLREKRAAHVLCNGAFERWLLGWSESEAA